VLGSSLLCSQQGNNRVESPAAYDPRNDPKRRPLNSKDPRWDYGYWADPKERDKVTCKLCNKRILGGIKRFKKHLAGGYGDVIPCPEANTELRKKMGEYLGAANNANEFDDDDGYREMRAKSWVLIVEKFHVSRNRGRGSLHSTF